MIKKQFSENFSMMKYICTASPTFLIITFMKEFLLSVVFFSNLLFTKFVVDQIYSKSLENRRFLLFCGLFYIVQYFIVYINWIGECHLPICRNKIKKHIQQTIYNQSVKIEVSQFDDAEFLNDFSRGVENPEYRLFNAMDFWAFWFRSFLYIATFIGILSNMNSLLMIPAMIMCIQFVAVTVMTNRIKIKSDYESTLPHRRRTYLTSLMLFRNYATEMKHYSYRPTIMDKYMGVAHEMICIAKKYMYRLLFVNQLSSIITYILMAVINIYVIMKIFDSTYTIGDLAITYASVSKLGSTLGEMLSSWPNLKSENTYVGYMKKILNHIPDITDNESGERIESHEIMSIDFVNVVYSYPTNKNVRVINNITINIKKGEKIALVGHNGSGKSTFINLLLYLHKHNSGQILINEKPYSTYNTKMLRSCFGVMIQDFNIYALSIAENILCEEADSDEKRGMVYTAIEFAGLKELIDSLPDGIDTIITKEYDENGIYLSGGEIQKLAIARAYASNRDFLVLDEPSSALDPISEKAFFNKLIDIGKDKTVIYVSHRLSTVVNADRLFVFSDGKVIEQGSHKELIKKGKYYYDMFTAQAGVYQTYG